MIFFKFLLFSKKKWGFECNPEIVNSKGRSKFIKVQKKTKVLLTTTKIKMRTYFQVFIIVYLYMPVNLSKAHRVHGAHKVRKLKLLIPVKLTEAHGAYKIRKLKLLILVKLPYLKPTEPTKSENI